MIGLARAVELLAQGALSAEELVRQCLARIEEREPVVQAFEALDAEAALREARRIDALPEKPLLRGVPVGVKDLIDTRDLPTGYGSQLYRGHQPAADADCVSALKRAGAIVLGKTVTTEFALYTPGKTRNPRDPSRTPGGSSSGSAAAVADGMLPLALGTQTAASVIRPASFCGVIGWKFRHQAISMRGIRPLAPSLDTLGFFVRELEDVPLALRALAGAAPAAAPREKFVFALCRTEAWERAEASTRAAVEQAAARLGAAGAEIRELRLPDGLVEAQVDIMGAEGALALSREPAAGLSPRLRDFVAAGRAVSPERLRAAHQLAEKGRLALRQALAGVDAVLTPAASGEAPQDLTITGDPLFSRLWTLLHAPSCTLPLLQGPAGLPLGLQLIAGDDGKLLAAARFAAQV